MEFLEELRRMNIHSASLFPGLDGFARSLAVNLDIAVARQIEEYKKESIEAIQLHRWKRSGAVPTPNTSHSNASTRL